MSKMNNDLMFGRPVTPGKPGGKDPGFGKDIRKPGQNKPFKPQTGGPMPKFQMPDSMGGTTLSAGVDKNMAKKQAIQKRFLNK